MGKYWHNFRHNDNGGKVLYLCFAGKNSDELGHTGSHKSVGIILEKDEYIFIVF